MIAEADRHFHRIDVLVNAAALTDRGNIFDTTEERYNEIFDVNVRAPFFLIQGAVTIMRREKIAGLHRQHPVDVGARRPALHHRLLRLQGRARHADENVAHSLLKFRIRVNGLNIGWMSTPGEDRIMKTYHGAKDGWLEKAVKSRPFGRLIDPREVARACAYLASERIRPDDRLQHRLRPEGRRRRRSAAGALSQRRTHGAFSRA